ncbi:acyloxyacyl hydrolase [Algoriphagus sp. A40]|uniref:acyloxyacyl hydrolase n=1 Tax=Algoriphagus sp. A40 TaxID=1945863 RepID=UPI00143C9BF9|nr:acyloxyacyl hydrolase [Algoriphagus sp. A40]
MFKLIKVGFFLSFVFLVTGVFAQEPRFQKSLNFSYETGPMLSNGTDWGDKVKGAVNYKALDFKIGWRKISNTPFNYLYRYPTLGFGFNSALENYEEIGRPQAVYGFMEIPFSVARNSRRVSFGYFLQLGVGFNLNPYDSLSNPDNKYIGSNINAYINMGLSSTIKFSERTDLQASFGLKHYSNGATKKPNAGINLFPLNLAMKIKLGDIKSIPDAAPEIPKKSLRTFWNLTLYTGMKNYEIGDPAYFRGGLGVNYLLEPLYKYRFGLGLDLFWAQGMEARFPEEDFSFKDQTSLAVVGSWEWQLTDRLYVPIAFGAYLYRNELNQEMTWFYERIGARYRFDNNMFAGMQIKAHKAKADFFEFTVGYTISGKR